jgi:hypothetical protein
MPDGPAAPSLPGMGEETTGSATTGAGHLADPDVRLAQLEEAVDALARELESVREDLRALASAVRQGEAEVP